MLKRIALIGTVFLFSCGGKNDIPSGIIKPAKMQLVLFDILRADAFVFEFAKKDSTKNPEVESVRLQQQIFTVHEVSKDEFYKSYDFYKTHPDLMQPLLDSMINKATRDKYVTTRLGNTGTSPPQADTSIGKAMRDKYGNSQMANNSDTPAIQRKLFKKKTRRLKKRTLNTK
jgi:Domain of unknown function (DUF4296)